MPLKLIHFSLLTDSPRPCDKSCCEAQQLTVIDDKKNVAAPLAEGAQLANAAARLKANGTAPLGENLAVAQQVQPAQNAQMARHVCCSACMPNGMAKALLSELGHLHRHGQGAGVSAFPEDERLLSWRATVDGPPGTPWEGRRIACLLRFCPTLTGGVWPEAPPKLLVTGHPLPFHPNVDSSSGAVCMDLLGREWSPAGGVLAILISFRSLLASPTTDDANAMPANPAAARAFLTDPEEYARRNR